MPLPATKDLLMREFYTLAEKGWPANVAKACVNLTRVMLHGIDPSSVSDERAGEALRKLIQVVALSANGDDAAWVLAGADLVGASPRPIKEIVDVVGAVKPWTRQARLRLAGDRIGITTDRRAADNELKILTALLRAVRKFLEDKVRLRKFQEDHIFQSTGEEDLSETFRRVRRLSRLFADELDIVVVGGVGRHELEMRLSNGLYVTRTQQEKLLEDLQTQRRGPAVAVLGDAGHGKSSLLWNIYQQLSSDLNYDVLLINASWLGRDMEAGQPALLPQSDLEEVVLEALARGRRPVVLIDTVDVMLHEDSDRLFFLETCDALIESGARLLLACRPEESAVLPKGQFASLKLDPYDTTELAEAIRLHVAIFCPDAPPRSLGEKVEIVMRSVSRGLPVREVCVNPLMLRLLFELHESQFPLMEIDISHLYELYWERRVKRDPRTEVSAKTSLGLGEDLSPTAEQIAVFMLSIGRVELPSAGMIDQLIRLEPFWPSSGTMPTRVSPGDAIEVLVRRGVLVRSGTRLRFFHQTMFEYAAARGLRRRDSVDGVRFLNAHIKEHPYDLFRAAVLEQLLILCLEDPAFDPEVDLGLRALATSDVESLQRCALVAIAHHPEYLSEIRDIIDGASVPSLRRFGQIVPTVDGTAVPDVVNALAHIWRKAEPCRTVVLEAFERVAAREAAPVVGALRDLDCFNYILGLNKDTSLGTRLLCRAIAAAAEADPEWAGQQLLAVFNRTAARSRKGRELPLYVLGLIGAHWSSLAVEGFLPAVEDAVDRVQLTFDASAHRMRAALGEILAMAWLCEYSLDTDMTGSDVDVWLTLVSEICGSLEANDRGVLTNARVIGIARRVTMCTSRSVATATVRRLLAIQSPPAARALARTAFPVILEDSSIALAEARSLLLGKLNGLPESAGKPSSDELWAVVVRSSLRGVSLAPRQLAEMLQDVAVARDPEVWLTERGLVTLLVQASIGGHSIARIALGQVVANASSLSRVARDLVSRTIPAHVSIDHTLVRVLVDLALLRRSGTPLAEVVLEHAELLYAELAAESRKLARLIDGLLAMEGDHQREAASLWLRLDAAGALPPPEPTKLKQALSSVIEPAAVGNLLRLAGRAAESGRLAVTTADELLRSRFSVEGRPAILVRPGRTEADDVAVVAREAWLRMTCTSVPIEEMDLSNLLSIASAKPARSNTFGFFHHLIIRLANMGRAADAAELITTVAHQSAEAGLSDKAELTVANAMRGAMRATFRRADPETRQRLLEATPALPKGHGRILVAAAAQECFVAVRPILAGLLFRDLPQGVRNQILNDMDVRRRHGSGGALRLLLPLKGWAAESGNG